MSNYPAISELKIDDEIAMWDGEDGFQKTTITSISTDRNYIATARYPDLAFDRWSGDSTEDTYRRLYHPLEAQDKANQKQREIELMIWISKLTLTEKQLEKCKAAIIQILQTDAF